MNVRLRSVVRIVAMGSLLLMGAAIAPPVACGAGPLQAETDNAAKGSSANDAMKDYDDSIRRGDAFYEAGNYFEAVRSFEHARRVAYNNKLQTDSAALERKLARATNARDGKPPEGQAVRNPSSRDNATSTAPAGSAGPSPAGPANAPPADSANGPAKDFDESVRQSDAFSDAGNHFEAVLALERAKRIAYNNRLKIDNAALEQKLARARDARDGKTSAGQASPGSNSANVADASGAPSAGGRWPVVELTALIDKAPRAITGRDVPQNDDQHYGPHGADSRWIVSNPYLPLDRHFLPYIWRMACATDGTLYLAGESVVPAAEAKRQPRANRDWYANNGSGVWKVAPDGKVTAFGVRPYGNQPGWDRQTAKCDADLQQAGVAVEHWGGMAVDSQGDIVFSDYDLHAVMKIRKDGFVEHVAGGGPQACVYDRYKTPQRSGYLDGPGKQALFNGPRGLAFDRDGNILVADENNCALRKIDRAGNVTTVNKGTCRFEKERMGYEYVVVDRNGLPIVGGSNVHMGVEIYGGVYRFHPDGRIEQLLAGRQIAPRTRQQHVGVLRGLELLPNGSLIISDADEQENSVLELRAGAVSRVLGLASNDPAMPEVDGPADKARLFTPGNLCSSGDGTLFILPSHSRRPVRKFDPRMKTVTSWVY